MGTTLMARKTLKADIHGRVQGVGFRYYASSRANTLDIQGWIRNEPDGSVHVECEGEETKLKAFEKWLHSGPPGAHVTACYSRWSECRDLYSSFVVEA